MSQRPPEQNIIDDAWSQVVGGMDWLKSVFIGEFADHRPLSAVVADMLVSFIPGVVIVTSARDAVAVILRLAAHPEKREELMEWVLLSACLIVIALPIAMAAGGAVAAGVGAIVGGIAGSELGAALRAVMLMLIKEATKLVELVRFLQKFIKGDILKFLRAVDFVKYEKALLQAIKKIIGKLLDIVKTLRTHLQSFQYFDSVKTTIIQLVEWEKRFYGVQQDAYRKIPEALRELQARLERILTQFSPKEAHTVAAGVKTERAALVSPTKQRVRDTPGNVLTMAIDNTSAASERINSSSKPNSQAIERPSTSFGNPVKDRPDPVNPFDEGINSKKQDTLDVDNIAVREKAGKIVEKIGGDIKKHPLRQAYETEVAGLKEEAAVMAKSGAAQETIARRMWERRRELGVKYKNVTPEPLRDYIYELNTGRYKDPLGPSFDSLVRSAEKKLVEPYQMIIDSSSRPNGDISGLLSKFGDWLSAKDPSYIDDALSKVGG